MVAVAGLVVGAGGVPVWTVLLPRTSIVITVSSGTQQMSLYHNDVAEDSSWFTPKPYNVIN